ncbi:arginyltransferase [Celerinatantimonas sp. YJH-8]|uniref:arginyltransferase n=1 Tax=Celerinatantimonas sp. YJH-8 TaxID=3228714 RepID=UPI0038CADE31
MKLQLGVTTEHSCSYLDDQSAREAVLMPENTTAAIYQLLIDQGFRRSGDHLYRPYCQLCTACQSLRVDVQNFKPTRSQRRVIHKNTDITWNEKKCLTLKHYQLYCEYQSARHHGGTMEHQSYEEFCQFLNCSWAPIRILEGYLDTELIIVSIIDLFDQGASAVYTFFSPQYAARSLGKTTIIQQINWLRQANKNWLYLGYQIDPCPKMNYKNEFSPHQRFINNHWDFEKAE